MHIRKFRLAQEVRLIIMQSSKPVLKVKIPKMVRVMEEPEKVTVRETKEVHGYRNIPLERKQRTTERHICILGNFD